ncbi:MAG: type II toxin-antitoxin system VapC family toxin [Actinomycetes bacterium]
MILVDSSAWIEFLRRTESPFDLHVDSLVKADAPLAVTDVVTLELLSGVRTEGEARLLQQFLLRFEHVATQAPGDFEEAALISRICRRSGETPRSRLDCLIAAVALRTGAEVLHRDRDFDLIARHVPLRIHAQGR